MVNPLFGSIKRPSKSEDAKATLDFIDLYRNADIDAKGIEYSRRHTANLAAGASATFISQFTGDSDGTAKAASRWAPYKNLSIVNIHDNITLLVLYNGHGTPHVVPANSIFSPSINPSIDYLKITATNAGTANGAYDIVVTVSNPPLTQDELLQRNVRYP